ncbi:MAG: hypothetical protein LBU90_03920 [Bacteroidales bacterium]|jgi:hypothetical protein|nr:hypothetical protein [Bacteroidales bacterium]
MSKIQNQSVFGNYSQKENTVTAALLQILRLGGTEFIANVISRIEEIEFPNNEINIVTQQKQNHNVYDGLLECDFSFRVLVESKIKPSSVDKTQLQGLIANAQSETDYILYITPDTTKPQELSGKQKIYWANWNKINEILQEVNPKTEPVNFLITEFEKYLEFLGLLDFSDKRVQIVAGSWSEGLALKYGFYACQNNRTRRPSKYLAFYNKGGIHSLFEIEEIPQNNFDLSKNSNTGINAFLQDAAPYYKGRKLGQFYRLKLINDTLHIPHTKSGQGQAYTMGVFRYTTIDKIQNAKTTADL